MRMSLDQKALIYYMVAFGPTSEEMKGLGTAMIKEEQVKMTVTEEKVLDTLGLDDAAIGSIKEQLGAMAGEFT